MTRSLLSLLALTAFARAASDSRGGAQNDSSPVPVVEPASADNRRAVLSPAACPVSE